MRRESGAFLIAALAAVATALPLAAQAGGGGADTARAAAPAPAAMGSPAFGWAFLAYDAGSGQLGMVAAADRFSVGSGVPYLDLGAGAVAVLGRLNAALGRRVLRALRGGQTAEAAVAAPGGGSGGTDTAGAEDAGGSGASQVAALTPGCSAAASTPAGLVPWSGSERGGAGSSCWLVVGTGLADSTLLPRLAAAYGQADGSLLDRFLAVLDAAARSEQDAPRSRSAVLWIAAPPGSPAPLGRGELRLQVDEVQRPADALQAVADAGRADALAARAAASVDSADYQAALDLSEKALDAEPATALAWLARGRALLFLGRADEAEQAFQRMLEVDPWLLHVLGDPATGVIRKGVIPYRPRLLQRLDVYRRAFWPDVTFPPDSAIGGG